LFKIVDKLHSQLDRRRVVDLLVSEFSRLQAGFKLANVIEACYTDTAGHHERFRHPGIAFDSKKVDIKILEFGGFCNLWGKSFY